VRVEWFLYYKLVFALFGRCSGGGRITLGNTSPVTSQLERKKEIENRPFFFFPRRHTVTGNSIPWLCVCVWRARLKVSALGVYIYVYV